MRIRNYRKKHPFAYNPMKPKVLAIRHSDDRPHGKRIKQIPYTRKDGSTGYRQESYLCNCHACKAYYTLIFKLNPTKYKTLFTKEEPRFFRPKALPEHVHTRKRNAYSIGAWNR